MNIQTKVTDPTKVEADILVVFAWEGKKPDDVIFSPEAIKVDTALGGFLTRATQAEGFVANPGKTFRIHTDGKIAASQVLIAGIGFTVANMQTAGAAAARRASGSKAKRIAVAFSSDISPQAVVEGIMLGSYHFTRHKTVGMNNVQLLEECIILTTPNKLNAVHEAVVLGKIVSEGVIIARDLVNEPPSLTTPTYLANVAKSIARGKTISCEVFDKSEMTKLGMGGLLGIARGTDEEPKFIKLSYKGLPAQAGGGKKTIALIGKGITFDTGGLSLKPANSMETMKLDMAGAATILGVFSVLETLKPKVNVVGLIAATENMPGSKAVKPGDIVKIMNGKTVEILNTDAEGRMVLADALSYAVEKVKPDVMIDLATLTGACVVALGEEVAGLFASHQTLADELMKSAKSTGEFVWQMPLVDEYREQMKGSIADLKNIGGGKWGGAITAAIFLQEFTSSAIPWAHIDIAGPAFAEKSSAISPVGGTGFGVRLLLTYLQSLK